MVDIFLRCDKRGLGQTLVVARDFDLFAVFVHLFEVVVVGCEFLELFLKLALHLGSNLVGALGDNAHGLIYITCLLRELNHVAGDGGHRGVAFFEIHLNLCFGELFALFYVEVRVWQQRESVFYISLGNLVDVVGFFAIAAVGVVVDKGIVLVDHVAETVGFTLLD